MNTIHSKAGVSDSRWSVIAAFAMVTVATQVLWVTFTPITTETANFYHVSDRAVGWLSEVFPLIYVLIAVPCGRMTDKWFRSSLAAGAVLTLLGSLVRIAPSYIMVLIGQILISIGQPLVINAINKIAALYVSPRHRPTAIAIGSASMFLGILLAMLSGPLLLPLGMSSVLWSQAVFTVVGVLWLLWLLCHTSLYTVPAEQSTSVRRVFADPWIRQLSLLLFVGFGLFIAVTTWLQVLLAGHGVSDLEVGIALALMTAAGIAGAGVLPTWAIRTRKSRQVILASLICSIAALFAIMYGRPFWLITALLVLTGFLILADLPIVLSTVEIHCQPAEVGTASGLLLLFGNAGGIILALLVQVFVSTPTIALLLLIVVSLVALPFARRFPLVTPPGNSNSDLD